MSGQAQARAGARELLRIEGLQSGYGEITVLWGVDLAVREGEITALIGSNGAGKSTLMRTLSGLVPARAGRVLWEGEEIQGCDPAQVLGRGIAHVPEGRRLFSAMTVEDNLIMGAFLRRIGRAELQRDLDRIYTIFPKLKERRNQAAGTMSGGEQQMCAIGRGLMSAPRLLMIDELSLGLSPLLVEQLIEALVALNRDEGLTILVVEQDVVTALELSHSAYVMDTGKVVQHGPSQELLRDPAVRQAYLGVLAE
ncbi:ABC transporter ATP-binding protein [Burkholderiaceae bacterium FT117]|uniref:ABC transporter ATP-binding protein n=1 Tax=Zeimonas sediminis TaxID=2944268 RepID=UPI002342E691|nr:ABC transporter ATP-binding protein [Zeimonas sediminis]MCM5571041.1 ABC transporter ATP-binding protein [Zeimonas sediminis]